MLLHVDARVWQCLNRFVECSSSSKGGIVAQMTEDFAPEKTQLPCSQIPPLNALTCDSPRFTLDSPWHMSGEIVPSARNLEWNTKDNLESF